MGRKVTRPLLRKAMRDEMAHEEALPGCTRRTSNPARRARVPGGPPPPFTLVKTRFTPHMLHLAWCLSGAQAVAGRRRPSLEPHG
jgi:hypothetical protein